MNTDAPELVSAMLEFSVIAIPDHGRTIHQP